HIHWQSPHRDVELHDHFDGSAHCVQCNGPCTLTGANLFATDIIRNIAEQWVRNVGFPDMSMTSYLERRGVNVDRLTQRARAARDARLPLIQQTNDAG